MEIRAKLQLASKNEATGDILWTFVLRFPRIILPEVNTHRMLSRNTASSRAIPSRIQRERVLANPFVPFHIGANQRGMQAGDELSGFKRSLAIGVWKGMRYPAVAASWALDKLGIHKQIVNRLVEPWTWTEQIVTATDLDNLFKLRCHKDAEPHFQILANDMRWDVELSKKRFQAMELRGDRKHEGWRLQILAPGEWHMPFIQTEDGDTNLRDISVARCARVSYNLPETGKRSDTKRDLELQKRLAESGHWSPFEHVAAAAAESKYFGNFRGWCQYRKFWPGESGQDVIRQSPSESQGLA